MPAPVPPLSPFAFKGVLAVPEFEGTSAAFHGRHCTLARGWTLGLSVP